MTNAPQSAAPASDCAETLDVVALIRDVENRFQNTPCYKVESFSFNLDDADFFITCKARDIGHSFMVKVALGYLPYTAESPEKREAIKQILDATHDLPHARFYIDPENRITIVGMFDILQIVTPDFIFYPLMLFMQETRPYIQLLRKLLA